MSKAPATYVNQLSDRQTENLRQLLETRGWHFDTVPHARWRARREKTTAIAYNSGKLVVQGKGTSELVQFLIEPEITGEARFGYEHLLAEKDNPAMFEPHIGVDESGKGDYFGPLVISAVYVDGETARELLKLGVQDSKRIGGDKRINQISGRIKQTVKNRFSTVTIGPEAYNRLYKKIGNLNRMLGWGHARALENVLDKTSDCPRAISDKFAAESVIRNSLQEKGKLIELVQIPRAEADVAVAAASILARAEFVNRLQTLAAEAGVDLPKGAGPQVLKAARQAVAGQGSEILERIAKLHFKTTGKVLEQS